MSNLSRRKFLSGAAVAGLTSIAGSGSAMAANRYTEGENVIQDVERNISSLQVRNFNNVLHVDVAKGPDVVQAAIDEADRKGINKVVIYGREAEWNKPVYLPSNSTLEILEGVKITSSMSPEDANPFEVGAGTVCGALFTNKDHENGNHNILIRGGI